MQMNLPDKVSYIINKLNVNGHKAYVVGGCIRDSLLERNPYDWDITTSAKPEFIKKIFDHTVDTGIKHGTITVMINNIPFEVTTFRVDGEYIDSRRPAEVFFTSDIRKDLSRRDFTVNAIAYHPKEGLIDPFNGKADLQKKLIRTVGNAKARFNEDALRMLRAVRFSAQLDFEIEAETLKAISDSHKLIAKISSERIRDELNKLLVSDNPMKFLLLKHTNLLTYIIPEFDLCFGTEQSSPYHIYDIALHSLHAVEQIENKDYLRLTMLLHDIGKPLVKTADSEKNDHFYDHEGISSKLAKKVMTRLKYDGSTIGTICHLINNHEKCITPDLTAVRKAISIIGEKSFKDLILVQKADILAQNPLYRDERIMKLKLIEGYYDEILQQNQCLSLDKLAVNGSDIIAAGIPKGRKVGLLLNRLLNIVLENPELNKKDYLLNEIEKIKSDF